MSWHSACSELTGAPIPAIGTTAFVRLTRRSPGVRLAGHHRGRISAPKRSPPSHVWAEWRTARCSPMPGLWLWAQWYERPGETLQQSIAREAAAVRRSVGACDVSTLGND